MSEYQGFNHPLGGNACYGGVIQIEQLQCSMYNTTTLRSKRSRMSVCNTDITALFIFMPKKITHTEFVKNVKEVHPNYRVMIVVIYYPVNHTETGGEYKTLMRDALQKVNSRRRS